jgi:hypothetical protein
LFEGLFLIDESDIRNAIKDAIAKRPETIKSAKVISSPPGASLTDSAPRAKQGIMEIEMKRKVNESNKAM